MKLTRLELSGFKSFADTMHLDFRDGITAIVGPNGCGKSNVSDAVRWVLGEQSARLLRGGKMEDVIFQGSSGRRPVNVTEVSLYLDNSAGTLPIAFQEVVVTRRLSRSGQSEYLLNGASARLRDIKDLLRGTGMGSDAGVVIEMDMIKALLSDRADERRALFEEAAGIGLYRDRKESSERRLGETATDLQRVEDLIAEVQSQLRSLARQKGKAERHAALLEEKHAVTVTLAKRLLDQLAEETDGMSARHEALATQLPEARERLAAAELRREAAGRARAGAEEERAEVERRRGTMRLELERVERDLALAAERLANIAERRRRAGEERAMAEARAHQAGLEAEAAGADRASAGTEREALAAELQALGAAETEERERLAQGRERVRAQERLAQEHAQALRALAGEREGLERDLAALRDRSAQAATHREQRRAELGEAERRRDHLVERAAFHAYEARRAATALDAARHLVAEAREHEARDRAAVRHAEEARAQLAARRAALEELERDRVGLAPSAAALLAARARFGDAVLGPVSDFVSTESGDPEVAERLLGEWMHAVLVRDTAALEAIRAWHEEAQPGSLVLLPVTPGPAVAAAEGPLPFGLRAGPEAEAWVRAVLTGAEVLDGRGRVFRQASGAIVLAGPAPASGPLRRRAELAAVRRDVDAA
ncbi:MAG: AAA family ATPase, partial [Gemmatimonadales bacterium]|nr:AAA family ATPase [Gemmatimonadales bacterium]